MKQDHSFQNHHNTINKFENNFHHYIKDLLEKISDYERHDSGFSKLSDQLDYNGYYTRNFTELEI